MWTVSEVSKLTKVSVRTLHHYDVIDLLKPTQITEAGYRLYDDIALKRLQNILMFRELQFSLKEIKVILDNPEFNPKEALAQQIKLLELQRNHIEQLISFAHKLQEEVFLPINGLIKNCSYEKNSIERKIKMNFDMFNKSEFDQYAQEVKERWGSTEAYSEYTQKTKDKTKEELDITANQLLSLFAEIGSLRQTSPDKKEVQDKIGELQSFITKNYYKCTDEILRELSQMYVNDERMKHNIDKEGGDGTADFVRQAILLYCENKKLV